MKTYLVTWNPERWPWEEFETHYKQAQDNGYFDEPWSVGRTKCILSGDRLFILKQGIAPVGIIGAGYARSVPKEGKHYLDPMKTALYIKARFEVLLRPDSEMLNRAVLREKIPIRLNWSPRSGGLSLPTEAAEALETLWKAHLKSLGRRIGG